MEKEKQFPVSNERDLGHQPSTNSDTVVVDHVGTDADRHDMYRMGKVQQMQRVFNLFPMFSFSMILMASWETGLGSSVISIFNGGTAGTIYVYIIAWIGLLAVYSSMAEMASMAPTSGGQYHWISEFAPPKFQKILSYAVGWLSVLGWQIAVVATAFQAGVQIQGLIVLNYNSYVFERWHGTLLIIAVVTFGVTFNTLFAKQLPKMEVVLLIFHICGFFGVLIPLLVLSKKSPSKEVWTSFYNSGWNSDGTSTLVGLIAGMIPMLGADAAAHMAEELHDASYSLPRTMMYSTLANGALNIIMIVSYCYCVGDIMEVASTSTGFIYIEVFHNATNSLAGTNAMVAVVITVIIFCSTTMLATTSRQLFAFSRDKGFPFSRFLAQIHPRLHLPINSILFSFLFSACISLINIGSTVAFNIINSVGTAALMCSYIVCISSLLWRKLTHQPLLPSRYPLGKGWLGKATNVFALGFLWLVLVFSLFPPMPAGHGLNPQTANWAPMILGVVVGWSVIYYLVKGRHVYDGPVAYVRKLE